MHSIGQVAKERVERVIVENEMLRAGFAAFPYLVMRDKNLTIGARMTYAFLLMYAWQEGSCFTKQDNMAEAMGVSARQLVDGDGEVTPSDCAQGMPGEGLPSVWGGGG